MVIDVLFTGLEVATVLKNVMSKISMNIVDNKSNSSHGKICSFLVQTARETHFLKKFSKIKNY